MIEQSTHDSSHIVSSAYDADKQLMLIAFKHNNARYVYTGVPPHIYQQFQTAKSAGRFLHQTIQPNFRAMRVG